MGIRNSKFESEEWATETRNSKTEIRKSKLKSGNLKPETGKSKFEKRHSKNKAQKWELIGCHSDPAVAGEESL